MNKITDDDLTLLFYGEHENPDLPAMVASSAELSSRFDALSDELKLLDSFVPPHRGDDYGAETWQRISPALSMGPSRTASRFKSLLAGISQPRFSLAGALSIALVAVLAFSLGRNGEQSPGNELAGPALPPAVALMGLDAQKLLTHSVSGHLEQVNLVLTQFANSTESSANDASFATDMLVANRLYRQAASTQGNHQLAELLSELEPLLFELAYEAQSGSATSRARMQKEVKNGLLFRIRFLNKQLKKPQMSV